MLSKKIFYKPYTKKWDKTTNFEYFLKKGTTKILVQAVHPEFKQAENLEYVLIETAWW